MERSLEFAYPQDENELPKSFEKDDDEESEGNIPEGVIDTETARLGDSTKKPVIDRTIDAMRSNILANTDYVMFAGAARYLQGESKGIQEPGFDKVPGDLDIAVFDNKTLDTLRDRLLQLPGVEFANVAPTDEERAAGKEFLNADDLKGDRPLVYKTFSGQSGTRVLKGRMNVQVTTDIGQRVFAVPFEIFSNSRIVPEEMKRFTETVHGVNVLSLEGLQQQALKNLELEQRVDEAAARVRTFLDMPEIHQAMASEISKREALQKLNAELGTTAAFEVDPRVKNQLESVDLTLDDVAKYQETQKSWEKHPPKNSIDQQKMEEALVGAVTAGLKALPEKRRTSVEQLRATQRVKVGEEPEEAESTEQKLAA